MGYSTDFRGGLTINPPLNKEQIEYIQLFAKTRRMRRDANIAEKLDDPVRIAAGLPIGPEAQYFVGGKGFYGQDIDESVTDNNSPPRPQPELWCQWTVSDDGALLEWDGGEKFYSHGDWLWYVITHFFVRWGRTLDGVIEWRGEDWDDTGSYIVKNNEITIT